MSFASLTETPIALFKKLLFFPDFFCAGLLLFAGTAEAVARRCLGEVCLYALGCAVVCILADCMQVLLCEGTEYIHVPVEHPETARTMIDKNITKRIQTSISRPVSF